MIDKFNMATVTLPEERMRKKKCRPYRIGLAWVQLFLHPLHPHNAKNNPKDALSHMKRKEKFKAIHIILSHPSNAIPQNVFFSNLQH